MVHAISLQCTIPELFRKYGNLAVNNKNQAWYKTYLGPCFHTAKDSKLWYNQINILGQ